MALIIAVAKQLRITRRRRGVFGLVIRGQRPFVSPVINYKIVRRLMGDVITTDYLDNGLQSGGSNIVIVVVLGLVLGLIKKRKGNK